TDQLVGGLVEDLERDGKEEQRVELAGVPDNALSGGRAEQREQHVFVVGVVEEALGQRSLRTLTLGLHPLEDRGLVQLEPDVDGEAQKNQRDDEWDAPAPLQERFRFDVGAAGPDDD